MKKYLFEKKYKRGCAVKIKMLLINVLFIILFVSTVSSTNWVFSNNNFQYNHQWTWGQSNSWEQHYNQPQMWSSGNQREQYNNQPGMWNLNQQQFNQPSKFRDGNLNQHQYYQLGMLRDGNINQQQYNQPGMLRDGNINRQQYNQPGMLRDGYINRQQYNQPGMLRDRNKNQQQFNQPSKFRDGNLNQQQNKLGTNNLTTTTTTTERTSSNPACDFKEPPKPNFRAPGRRISVVKCVEYIWERQNREEKSANISKCQDSVGIGGFRKTVVGGRDALPGEFPHMGGVGWRAREGTWIFKCGCSLISSKFTLTAAHCSKSSRDTSVKNSVPEIVRLGDKNIIDVFDNGFLPRDAKILRIIVHPNYSSPKKYFDIALMEIEEIKSFTSYIQPACLWSQFDTSRLGTSATVTGWGVIETATKKTSPKLQAAAVDLIDSAQCDALLRPSCNRLWCGIQDHQICGGKLSGGLDACQGDSGGPLQVKIPLKNSSEGSIHNIIGVTSFGVGCALPESPGVYTRVSSFIDWIESIVWPEDYFQ